MPSDTGNKEIDFLGIEKLIKKHDDIVISSHLKPDGDAIGSSLSLGLAIQNRYPTKNVTAVNQDPAPEVLGFLPKIDLLHSPSSISSNVDLLISVDTANSDRLGDSVVELSKSAKEWINIDHHPSNTRYGDHQLIVPTAPAVGEIIFQFIESTGFEFSDDICKLLFVAISTDTGSFRFPQTSAETFRIASELLKGGASTGELSESLYSNYPLRRLNLTQELFSTMQLDANGKIASWALTKDVAKEINYQTGDAEGLIDILRSVKEVDLAIYFEEHPNNLIRVSARSRTNKIDVSELCGIFGGGGHVNASGATITGPLEDVRKKFISEAIQKINGNSSF